MRATLVEVEGEAVGSSLYSMDWLQRRARQHLQALDWPAAVLVAEEGDDLLGHTLLREDPPGQGLISTTWIWPQARRRGVARALLKAGEAWMREQGLSGSCTWTSGTNQPLIALYESEGYRAAERHPHAQTGTWMVALRKSM